MILTEKKCWNFYKKELQNTDQKVFRIEKVIKIKGDNIYVKWTGYNNSFNSWIDKEEIQKKFQNRNL